MSNKSLAGEHNAQTILVTGGAGFIGSHTCVELLEAGHDVVILDDLSNASGTVIDKIETITGKRPAFYQADAKDRAVLHEIFTARSFASA